MAHWASYRAMEVWPWDDGFYQAETICASRGQNPETQAKVQPPGQWFQGGALGGAWSLGRSLCPELR